MKTNHLIAALAGLLAFAGAALPLKAETTDEYQEGFLSSYLNKSIAAAMDKEAGSSDTLHYGRDVTKYVSAPQFGGYIVGKYGYSTKDHANTNSFECRLVRMYVSGTVLRDFRYRVQVELRNTPAMRDYTLEWIRFKEFQVKVGQFKRCFTYENPMNPWDVGLGGYSQLAQRMAAFGAEDCNGEPSQNGRDPGIQFSGDLFPVGKDHRRLIRYQAGIFNGNGQNLKDNNTQKDLIGNIQVQPVKDLYVGLFGWTGTYTGSNGVSVMRRRWALSGIYEHGGWSARAEYAHHTGGNVNDFDTATQTWKPGATDRADAWYAQVGVPVTQWLKIYGRYDVYRKAATWGSMRSVYSIAPNFRLHRNLLFQMQYNYVNDRLASDRNYHELWSEFWVRF